MTYLSTLIPSLLSTISLVFLIASLGYLFGRITINKISLGTAGTLVAALAFGVLASYVPYVLVGGKYVIFYLGKDVVTETGYVLSSTKPLWSLISSIGTAMFVTSVGLIAGPKFFRMFNKKSLNYIVLGVIIILIGSLLAIGIIKLSHDPNVDSSLVVGLMTGALTSTPGFSAAKEVAFDEAKVTAGYGIAYLFGVLGVVLFVQIVPKLLKVDIEKERALTVTNAVIQEGDVTDKKRIQVDSLSFFPFFLTVVLGSLIGAIKIPIVDFSLGSSGGMLIAGLIIGHFGHIGPIDCHVSKGTLNCFRELGLVFFLIGAGVPGGVNFISNVKVSYFIYGAVITLIPMVVGYILGKYVFRMSIFNNLGSITGGMTSTPALGALIQAAGTDEVAGAYVATYPVSLFCIVIAARIIASI